MALMASPGDCGENRPRISRFRGGKILYGPPFKLLVILKLMDMEELMQRRCREEWKDGRSSGLGFALQCWPIIQDHMIIIYDIVSVRIMKSLRSLLVLRFWILKEGYQRCNTEELIPYIGSPASPAHA